MGRFADGPHKRKVIEVALAVVLPGACGLAVSTHFVTMGLGEVCRASASASYL
jgi:hypothetical protein